MEFPSQFTASQGKLFVDLINSFTGKKKNVVPISALPVAGLVFIFEIRGLKYFVFKKKKKRNRTKSIKTSLQSLL